MRALRTIALALALSITTVAGVMTALNCQLMPSARFDCRNGDRTACAFVAEHPFVDAFVSL